MICGEYSFWKRINSLATEEEEACAVAVLLNLLRCSYMKLHVVNYRLMMMMMMMAYAGWCQTAN
jgi:hypothetical protein